MAKNWDGKSYDEGWNEVDGTGQKTGYTATADEQAGWNAANTTSIDIPAQGTGSNVAPTPTAAAPGSASDWQGLSNNVFGTVNKDMTWNGTVDQNDPAYKQQVDANQLQTDRAADRARASMAARRQATGTGMSGAMDTDANKVLEQQAYQDKTFEGNILDKFRQQGLDQKARALQLGSGMLTAEQERALRGSLTREGYDVQRDLAADDLGFRRDALGQQLALSQADLDQRAMMALLGGA
jgi:hypothetical protein